nr:hypothetical protein [Tanacetum cinerariifolium]
MADENVPAQAPTDLMITYFYFLHGAFTTSAFVLAIYIQQFWNTLTEALEITLIDQAHQFVSPPSGDAIMDFVNQLGYTEVIHFVSRMALISNNIINAPYYNAYLEMVTKHDQKVAAEKEGKMKIVSAKQPKSKPAVKKESKPAPAPKSKASKERHSKASANKPPKPKPTKEKSTKTTLPQSTDNGKAVKVHKAKRQFQLVDEPDEEPAHSEPEPKLVHQGESDEDDMELAMQMSLETFQAQSQAHVSGVAIREPIAEATRPLLVVEDKGKAIVTEEQAAQSLLALYTPKRRSITDQFILQRRTPTTEEASTRPSAQPLDDTSANIGRDSPSPTDAETGARSDKSSSGDQGQAGPDPGRTPESQPPPEQEVMDEDQAGPDPGESREALTGPDPDPTQDEFMVDLYLKVHESLKFSADEHVFVEDPISSTETLSSMKNLEDAFAIGDQFINDRSTEDEPEKPNLEAEVGFMVTVPIYQAYSLVPPLATPIPVIDLSPPKPTSSTTQAPVFTATKATTTTPLPPPPQQHSSTESELAE